MFLADTHSDTLFSLGVGKRTFAQTDITPDRLRQGGVSLQTLALWSGPKGPNGDYEAVANAEYIYYASPNRLVYEDPEYIEDMGEDTMDILYPGIGSFRDEYNRSAYRNLDQDTLTFVNSLWETLKIN